MRIKWEHEMLSFLLKVYPHYSNRSIAILLGCTEACIKQAARRRGMKKSEQRMVVVREKTYMKKGGRPPSAPPPGTITVRKHSGYKGPRVHRDGKLLHRVLWEEQHGPIPKGSRLRCKTNDPLNTDPSNWELVTDRDWMERIDFKLVPPELNRAIRTLAHLKSHLKKLENNQTNEENH